MEILNKTTKEQSKNSFYETLDAYIEQELQWLVDTFFWKLKTRVRQRNSGERKKGKKEGRREGWKEAR